MKTVILAGGQGARLGSERLLWPKPLAEIGGRPLLWHLMHFYASQGFQEFIVALGYRATAIREYFLHFGTYNHDVTLDLATGTTVVHAPQPTPWKVHLIDTGQHTNTAGRLKRVAAWLDPGEAFFMTYCDGLANLDLGTLLRYHRGHGRAATLTAVTEKERFGRITWNDDDITQFREKPSDESWINGGFYVVEPSVMERISGDACSWESDVLPGLASAGQLCGYRHRGFWMCIDTPEERQAADALFNSGSAPWRGLV
jgi:glucose-1-phosphate cytidylyltransferase